VHLVPPAAQMLTRPGVIRWVVGTPAGPRSHTWSVVGHNTGDDVFIGLRNHMGQQKLSLHPAKWRMAFTEQAANAMQLPDGVDRAITRWEHPPELAPGWRRGAVIAIPTAFLGPGYPEKRPKGGTVSWWPAPGPNRMMRFDVLLGTPEREDLTILDVIGEVGRMTLSSGTHVWITADEVSLSETHQGWFADLRRRVGAEVPRDAELRGWAWGNFFEDDAPFLIDLGSLPPVT
jgi:hypothetical protein